MDDLDRIELHQFPYSHYNEKARWALDWKGLAHRRTSHLPGPHLIAMQRLSGQNMVPVARFDETVVPGSAAILDELERRHPDPPLYPEDPSERRRALEIQNWFDEEIAPMVRVRVLAAMLPHPEFVARTFGHGQTRLRLAIYRVLFPVVRRKMSQSIGIADPGILDRAEAKTREGLEFVARESAATGYLVGERFTVADLAAAALLAPACSPPGSPMELPEPRPPAVQSSIDRFQGHAGVGWVWRQYREHRPPTRAVTSPA